MSRFCCLLLLLGPCLVSSLTPEELALFTPRVPGLVEPTTGQQGYVMAEDNGDGSHTITTNNVPSHQSGGDKPIQDQYTRYNIFSDPIMRAEPLKCLPNGAIGIATSGSLIYTPYLHEEGCPYAAETYNLDACSGVVDPVTATYHYRSYSPCVQTPVCGEQSPLYGVALDGIPIYGPIDEYGRQMVQSDLDECGGKYDSWGRYRYHVTIDPPYFPTCFKGEIRSDVSGIFTCTCPFTNPGSETAGQEPVCEAGTAADEPAICEDKIPEMRNMTYKWGQEWREVELAACCPSGQECGVNCAGPGECVMERRLAKVWNRTEKEVSCWERCYVECAANEECNCKRKCKRACLGNNGYSDRKKRASERDGEGKCKKPKRRS